MTFLVFLVSFPLSVLWRGFVVSKLWTWHVVTVFGVASLTVSESVSVSLMMVALTHQMQDTSELIKEQENVTTRRFLAVAIPLLKNLTLLAFGWLVHVFQR